MRDLLPWLDRRLAVSAIAALLAAPAATIAQIKTDLADLVIGATSAPVVIEEYASLTCQHCAEFHNTVLPALRAKYIDTGRVKLIYRDFPLNELAVGAAMLTRCAGTRREALIAALFKTQETWAFKTRAPLAELYKLGQQHGMGRSQIEGCLGNEIMFAAIVAQRDELDAKLKIAGTPTFFINGKRLEGRADFASFDKMLTELVK
jgi:protein-disulfide isomerase